MRHKYWVLYTGGTIGMRKTELGFVPDLALVEKALLPFEKNDTFVWHVCDPLIDSSALEVNHWQDWLNLIRDNIHEYDGILILHGTDTMAYTANMLAFALKGLNKPVVLTGSQWPYGTPNSDAPLNLETAIAALNLPLCQEVCIAFNGALWQAIGSSKVSTETAAGFSTPHYPPLGIWNGRHWQDLQRDAFLISDDVQNNVEVLNVGEDIRLAVITVHPAFSASSVAKYLDETTDPAVIIQSYGHGNAPEYADTLEAMRSYINRGNVIVNISQVKQGHVASLYAQGHSLVQVGVVNGGKWNLETAVGKLVVGLSMGLRGNELKHMLLENWVGEWNNSPRV